MATPSALAAFLLCGCPAEDLGVTLPVGGPGSISQEDLQRDIHLVTSLDAQGRGPGTEGASQLARGVELRLKQMGTEPAFGRSFRQPTGEDWNICGQRQGPAPADLLILAQDGGQGADLGASAIAAMISLAKSVDLPGEAPRGAFFCRLSPWGGQLALLASPPLPWEQVDELLLLGPLGGSQLALAPVDALGREALLASTGSDPVHGTAADRMERLDFRQLETHVRALHKRFFQQTLKERTASPAP